MDQDDRTQPIRMPIPGPGMPRETSGPPMWIPVAVPLLAAVVSLILYGVLWW